jgi:hypothetical protein
VIRGGLPALARRTPLKVNPEVSVFQNIASFEEAITVQMSEEICQGGSKCRACDWTGSAMRDHLRHDHDVEAVLAPYNRRLTWAIDVGHSSPPRLPEDKQSTDKNYRRWSILVGCRDRAEFTSWFHLFAAQKDEGDPADNDLCIECIDLAPNRIRLTEIKMCIAVEDFEGLWVWRVPLAREGPQHVPIPAQVVVKLAKSPKPILTVTCLLKPEPVILQPSDRPGNRNMPARRSFCSPQFSEVGEGGEHRAAKRIRTEADQMAPLRDAREVLEIQEAIRQRGLMPPT